MQIALPNDDVYVIRGDANLEPLLPFFTDSKYLKIIQNVKFDTKFILHKYNIRTKNLFDTMLAEQIINGNDARGTANLYALALKYPGVELDKSIRDTFHGMKPTDVFTDGQLRYAGEDATVLFPIMEAQHKKLKEEGLLRVAELEFELAPVVASMELVGVPVNQEKWKAIIEEQRALHEQSRAKLIEMALAGTDLVEQVGMFGAGKAVDKKGKTFDPNSNKQVGEVLTQFGIKLPLSDKDNLKVDERTLSKVDHPFAKELLEYRGLQKIMTSYGTSFLDKVHPFTGRFHADFQQIGTATGRFACKEPNLQQMPEDFRECVSEKDYKIVGADYANIELRILAELSGDDALRSAFETGADPHTSTASLMFNIPIENVTKEQRFIGKTLNFGISYGMGPGKLMDMLNKGKPKKEHIGFRATNNILDRYKETYKKANLWLLQAGTTAYRQGYSETMMGRRRYFERPTSSGDRDKQVQAIKRQGANSPIQGTNADITKLAMLNLYHDLKTYNMKADIILQVHDEIGVLAHKSQAESVKLIVEESMMTSAQEILTKVPVKVDTYISDEWKKG